MTNIKAYARRPQGDRTVNVRRPCGQTDATDWRSASVRPTYGRRRGVYDMATVWQISTANVEMKKVITPRYNSTATLAACKT